MAIPGKARRIVVRLHPQNLIRLQNERRQEIVDIEANWGGRIVLEAGEDLIDNIDIKCYKH